jgi:hypothetical protein
MALSKLPLIPVVEKPRNLWVIQYEILQRYSRGRLVRSDGMNWDGVGQAG